MAIVQKLIHLVGSKGSQEEMAIFDSGSTYFCIQPELVRKLETVVSLTEPMESGTAENGETLTATERVVLSFYLDAIASPARSCSS